MKSTRLARLPQLVRSIFLPRKTTVSPAGMQPINRRTSLDAPADGRIDDVLDQAVDLTGLLARLRSSDMEVSRDAAVELGRIGDRAALQPLVEVMTNANGFFHPLVRAAAACSLGQIRDCRATDALIAATADQSAEVSEAATVALGAIGEVHSIEPLMDIVANHNGFFLSEVRRAAIRALGQFHDARVSSMLLAVSMNDNEDPAVRQAAKELNRLAIPR